MSFLKSLFGWGKARQDETAAAAKEVEHKGYLIAAKPFLENGQYGTFGAPVEAGD